MTTKEKFVPVARLVRSQLKLTLLAKNPKAASVAITRLANDLATLITAEYPRFARDEFLKGCGIDDSLLTMAGLPLL
ncbi:MAG: hypothetical protein ABSF26_14125 [Thermoguttaceae bacterium]|jgi:hypothetical protein